MNLCSRYPPYRSGEIFTILCTLVVSVPFSTRNKCWNWEHELIGLSKNATKFVVLESAGFFCLFLVFWGFFFFVFYSWSFKSFIIFHSLVKIHYSGIIFPFFNLGKSCHSRVHSSDTHNGQHWDRRELGSYNSIQFSCIIVGTQLSQPLLLLSRVHIIQKLESGGRVRNWTPIL